MRAAAVRVDGRVQGVGFRWHAARRATEVGAVGWVRNELDGSVSAHVEGEDEAVEAMIAWLRYGPPSARVDVLTVRQVAVEGLVAFRIER